MYMCAIEKIMQEGRIVSEKRRVVALLNGVQGRLTEMWRFTKYLKEGRK